MSISVSGERPVYQRNFTPEQLAAKREYVRQYQARKRASQRDVKLRPPKDPARRLACEADPVEWLRVYCPDRFFNPFTAHQKQIIADMIYTLQHGGDKALADIRGGGKTSMTEAICGGFWNVTNPRTYGVIISKNTPNSRKVLNSIKSLFEYDDPGILTQDYPEICLPIQALQGWASRGKLQTVMGIQTQILWTGDMIQFPLVYPEWCQTCYSPIFEAEPICQKCGEEWGEEVEDIDEEGKAITVYRPKPSRVSKNCLASFGIDAAFVGLKQGSLRPTYAILDDIETEESALSPDQVEDKERIIENSIGGLAGPTSMFSRIMLCTVRGPVSLAAKYTDPQEKPAWRGQRYSQVTNFPTNEDMWKEYMFLRKKGQRAGDAIGTEANNYYLANQAAMDEGVEVLNPYRKSPGEVSAIQHVYNKVADRGWGFVIPEYQNQIYAADLEAAQLPSKDFILLKTHPMIQPVEYTTAFIDISKKVFWWMICDWGPDFSGKIRDYGIFPQQRQYDVTREITEVVPGATEDERLRHIYEFAHKLIVDQRIDRLGVDIGWRDEVVTPQTDGDKILACRGMGQSLNGKPLHEVELRLGDIARDNWRLRWLKNDSGRYRVLQVDADFWKSVVHDKLSAAPDKPGSLMLSDNRKDTNDILALHLLSESRKLLPGRYRQFWKYSDPVGDNHWLDCLSGCCVLASTLGLQLTHQPVDETPTRSWKELADLQRSKQQERIIDHKRNKKREFRNKKRNRR